MLRARVKVPLLMKTQYEARLYCSTVLLNDVRKEAHKQSILFSVENLFTVDAISSLRNDR